MSFISGAYTATYKGANLGQTSEGFRMSHSFFKRLVSSDQSGQTPVTAIYQGREQFVGFTLLEADQDGVDGLIEPYSSGGSVGQYTIGPVGQMDVQFANDGTDEAGGVAGALVLTAIAGTQAADFAASYTFALSAIAEGFNIETLLGPDLREIPIRMRAYPDAIQNGLIVTAA